MAVNKNTVSASLGTFISIITSNHSIKALIGYSVLAVFILAPFVSTLTTHVLADDIFFQAGVSDAYTNVWTYWWVQKAALTGEELFYSNWVLPPTGANLVFHSTSILPTLITIPLAKVFGSVSGYNLMVLMLIVLGAWMYYLFLYYTWNVSAVAAFISGALFGFCPYHVVKAHAHINLIGACFWGGALAVLVYSYVKNRFRWPYAVLFAVLLWSTFWTSFVEFFMLAVVLVCVVAVMEIGAFSSRTSGLPRRIMFYLPAMVGAVPAALFLSRAPSDIVDVKLYQQLAFVDLMTFPKLSVLSGLAVSSFPEFWGVYVPVSTIMLAIPGVVAMRINGRKGLKAILILAGICLAAVLDPFHAVSGILRSLPMGTGFRVFSRFFPFFLFFFLILACHGLNHIIQKWKLWARVSVALAFLAITITEYYPQGLNVSPVKNFSLNARQTNQLKRDRFVLVIPEGRYRNVHDTYQVTMNMRFVYLSYLARTDTRIAAKRRQRFPMVYAGKPIGNQEEFLRELKKLGVGYVLFENAAQAANFPLQGDVVHESNNELLMSICDQL